MRWLRTLGWVVVVVAFALQVFFGVWGIDAFWPWGHHGFNPAAYQTAAWNSIEWGNLFPAQYHTADTAPPVKSLYTHAPLLLHLHTWASVAVFGDGRWAVRLVPALYGVLAAVAVFLVMRRHFGFARAVVALSVYVLLPINHGFANMTNHSTGLILWGLIALDAHLRGRHWWCLGAILLCCNWDWPGYYIAFAIAVHWLGSMWRRRAPRELIHLSVFSAAVLVSFVGFFALVYVEVGSFDLMERSWSVRTKEVTDVGRLLVEKVFDSLFGVAALGVAGLWLLSRAVRLRDRDLIPLSFLLAGLIHTGLFKATALVHIYWVWPLNVFVAIAVADFLMGLGDRWLPRHVLPYVRGAALVVFSFFFLSHTLPLVEGLRRQGGSLHKKHYRSNYDQWVFADQVRRWSAPDDTLRLVYGFNTRPEIVTTLHRHVVVERRPRKSAALHRDVHLVGDLRRVPKALIAAVERRGRVDVVYPYFYARPSGPKGRVTHEVGFLEDTWWWQLTSSSFEPRVQVRRVTGAEESPRGKGGSTR